MTYAMIGHSLDMRGSQVERLARQHGVLVLDQELDEAPTFLGEDGHESLHHFDEPDNIAGHYRSPSDLKGGLSGAGALRRRREAGLGMPPS